MFGLHYESLITESSTIRDEMDDKYDTLMLMLIKRVNVTISKMFGHVRTAGVRVSDRR